MNHRRPLHAHGMKRLRVVLPIVMRVAPRAFHSNRCTPKYSSCCVNMQGMRTFYQLAALEESREAIIRYGEVAGQRHPEALDREINAKLALLKDHALIGTHGVGGSRWLPLRRFPYTLHYRVVGDVIDILALAHQKRHPGYWRQR